MRAVKGKRGILSILSRQETSLFDKIELSKFQDISTLTERDHYICEELYQRNVLQKVRKGDKIGYRIYAQQAKL
jgi:hypothetical protein